MDKNIDWQMIGFIFTTLIQEHWVHSHLPQIYYWDIQRRFSKK